MITETIYELPGWVARFLDDDNSLTLKSTDGSLFLATEGDFIVNTDDLVVDTSTGCVGIGTSSPLGALHVKQGSNTYGIYSNDSFTNPTNTTYRIYNLAYPSYTEAETATENFGGYYGGVRAIINGGHTNSGSIYAALFSNLRNCNGAAADDDGTLTNMYGLWIQYGNYSTNASAAPVTTNTYGIYVSPYFNKGTITNMYDLYLAIASSGGTVTNRWSIYQAATASQNYFGSPIGIGQTEPTALLHIKAGTATASTAPIKLTSGTLLGTAEAGAIEFLTNAFYGTITTGPTRKTFAFLESPSFTTPNIGVASGTSLEATGLIKSSSATAGIGYAAGAGDAQTQGTSKATTVTINAICGTITTHNATLNAATIVSFQVTNSAVAATDVVIVNHDSGGTLGAYTVNASGTATGHFHVDLRNNSASNLSEALVIRFAVIKAVVS